MSNMNSKNNVGEATNATQKGGEKWVGGILALIALSAGFSYTAFKKEPLDLTQLVQDIEYEVVEVEEKDNQIVVDIQMDESEEATVEVVKAVVNEVKQHGMYQSGETIKVEVFKPTQSQSKPTIDDSAHQMTGVYEESLKVYQLKNFSEVEADILATTQWKIENSKYENGHLTAQVFMTEESSEEVIYSQLKALENEMVRFNKVEEGKETYFKTIESDQIVYGYSSVYPNHLIVEKEILILNSK